MQGLTDPPRDTLTAAQVTAVLTAPALQVAAGLDLVSAQLQPTGTLDLIDGQVQRVMAATVHGTCRLVIDTPLAWGVDLVRPWITLTDQTTRVTARFNVGVFCLTTPQDVYGDSVRAYEVQGYDRLYLLDRLVGDTYTVTAGTDYLTAITAAITAAGLTGVLLDRSAAGKTLPSTVVWPLVPAQGNPSTWLNIVNDLLAAIGYRGLWADENGYFRSSPYVTPGNRASEFTLDADSTRTVLGYERRRTQDVWSLPNAWRFVQRNLAGDPPPAPVEGTGIYTVQNTTGLLTRWRVEQLDAADQAALVAQGDRIVANDRRVAEVLSVTTGPLPIAGHADVLTYRDVALGAPRKVQASQWTLPLNGDDMSWSLETTT